MGDVSDDCAMAARFDAKHADVARAAHSDCRWAGCTCACHQRRDPCVNDSGMPTPGCIWPECGAQDVDRPCPMFRANEVKR